MEQQAEQRGFSGLGIAPALLDVLRKLQFTTPTPIQSQAIPVAIQGKDLVGIAQTGTGKTLAFGIPMIQLLSQGQKKGLVVLPTRELALQVEETLRKTGASLGIRTAVLIGGAAIVPQIRDLRRNPHIVIGTPGRINDHLQQKTLRLDGVGICVLDEADRMLDMGFLPQIQKILQVLPKERQTMLFSATMPQEIMRMAQGYMRLPIRIEIAPTGTTAEKVAQEVFIVPREQKLALLKTILDQYKGSTLVFTKTKYGARNVTAKLEGMGFSATEIHSNRSLSQRKDALQGFKTGRYRVLVATDIASRGIDVVGIELVVNFDLPSTSEDYVHRIGRTARAGAEGRAITFATPAEQRDIWSIERLIRKRIPVSRLPEKLSIIPMASSFFRPRNFQSSSSRPWSSGSGPARSGYGASSGSGARRNPDARRVGGGSRGPQREQKSSRWR